MAIITPPANLPVKEDSWTISNPAQENESFWSGSRQVILRKGSRWLATTQFAPLSLNNNAKQWRAFIAQLKGIANQFPIYPEGTNAQHAFANPLVNGADQTGNSLNVDGLNNGEGLTLLQPGDWATVTLPGSFQLLMVTSMTATTSGAATINFEPILRESPADNALIETVTPYAHMSSVNRDITFGRDIVLNHSIELDLRETW